MTRGTAAVAFSLAIAAASIVGCQSSAPPPAGGSGGRVGSGGSGTGGASSTGGAPATGGASATGGSGGTGGGTFVPCPAAGTMCVVMPLGDSITDGFGTPGGYRIDLFRTAVMNSKRIHFTGRKSNGPDNVVVGPTTAAFPKGHEGYSGYTIEPSSRSGLSAVVDDALMVGRPHIILLMIGTNDVDLNLDVATAPTRLGRLLDRVIAGAPNALLVVAKLTPLNYDEGNARVRAYNDAIPALVQARAAAGKHILMVDMYAPFVANTNFKTALLADQWHPNPAGYLVMSQVWYDAIQGFLP